MPRIRRYFRSGRPYELDIRVKSGLPFACLELIKLLLDSAIARAHRDGKVKICRMQWMGNHLHLLRIIFDADEQCIHFFQVEAGIATTHRMLWKDGKPASFSRMTSNAKAMPLK